MYVVFKEGIKKNFNNIWYVKFYIFNGVLVLINELWCEEFRYKLYDDV